MVEQQTTKPGAAGGIRQFKRFLLTGCESGVYRAGAIELAPEQTLGLRRFVAERGPGAVDFILDQTGSRPEAVFFALAVAASPRFASHETNSRALAALPLVARKAQDLAAFATHVAKTRGWGRGLRNAVADWYANQPVNALAAQILRHPAKNAKQHRAILRLAHPKASNLAQNALYQWISDGKLGHLATPEVRSNELRLVDGFERARKASSLAELATCIEDYRLAPAHIPARWRTSAAAWEAMFDHLSYRQLLRYLPLMTASGLLGRHSEYAALAVARLADRGRIRTSGIDPLRIVEAMKQYRNQHHAVESIFDALDEALHLAADCQPAIGRRVLVAVDGTGSMQGAPVCGMPHVPAALAGATLALSIAKAAVAAGRQNLAGVLAFHRDAVREIEFSTSGRRTRLADVLNQIRATPSRSDAALPVEYAIRERLKVESFVIVTDRMQGPGPLDALQRYREATGIDAHLALINLSGREVPGWNGHDNAIAIAGLDAHAPVSLREFLRESAPGD